MHTTYVTSQIKACVYDHDGYAAVIALRCILRLSKNQNNSDKNQNVVMAKKSENILSK